MLRIYLLFALALPALPLHAAPKLSMQYARRTQAVDVAAIQAIRDWQPVTTAEFNGSFSRDHFYFRIFANNDAAEFRGVLELPFRRLEHVELISTALGRASVIVNGAVIPVAQRALPGAPIAFPLVLAAGESREFYLHVYSSTAVKVQPLARAQQEFDSAAAKDILYSGVFSGLLALLVIYNLILFWAFRRRVYLAYILTNFGALIYYLSFDGILTAFIFPEQPQIAHAILSPAGIWYSGTYLIFVAWFSALEIYSRRFYYVFFSYSLLLVVVSLLGHWLLGPAFMNRSVMQVSITAIPLSVIPLLLHKGRATADYRWFQVGTLLLLVFASIFMAYLFGFLRENLFTRNALRIGTLLELLFFSVALAMRIRSLDRERKDAEVRASARTQFAATVSHEIRTPLTAIIGLSELLQDTKLDQQQKKYATSLSSAASVLHALANDVLTFAKLDAEKVRLEQIAFSPQKVAEQTVEVYRFKAAEKKIDLRLQVDSAADVNLLGDPGKIGQILNNLTSNAIKFTPENGRVVITVSTMSVNNKYALVMSVTDSGIGIAEDKQQQLFQAFVQADADTERLYGGTGLGLNISQRLARLMHGKLVCESTPGKGSKFTFTVLLNLAPAIEAKEQVDFARIIRNLPQALKILHIDDSPEMRMLFQFYFAHTNHQVDSAETAEDGVALYLKHTYDFVFSDMHMPGIGGLAGIQQMREEMKRRAATTHFILLSGSLLEEDLREPGVRVLHKPIRTRDIYAVIAELGGYAAPAASV